MSDETSDASEEKFSITLLADQGKGVMELSVERLARKDVPDFQEACDRLRGTGQKELVIDAAGLHSISSVYIGVLINAAEEAKKSGQHMVLATGQNIADLLHKLIGDSFEIQVVPE